MADCTPLNAIFYRSKITIKYHMKLRFLLPIILLVAVVFFSLQAKDEAEKNPKLKPLKALLIAGRLLSRLQGPTSRSLQRHPGAGQCPGRCLVDR